MTDNLARLARLGQRYEALVAPPEVLSSSQYRGNEPAPGSVVKFKVLLTGRTYDYAAIRAGDGRWYLTGGETKQGVSWQVLLDSIRPHLSGPVWVCLPSYGFTP